MNSMHYIGLDVHKKTISYCVKDGSGQIHQEGKVGATRWELDRWMKTLPQPWTVAMEASIFTGWIYDHLLPHAQQVKVVHHCYMGIGVSDGVFGRHSGRARFASTSTTALTVTTTSWTCSPSA